MRNRIRPAAGVQPPPEEPNRTNMKVIFGLSAVHFTGDFYNSFINPLLPVFVDRFALTLAQVGLITGVVRILAFIVQPCVGYFADRYRSRVFILGGPLLSILFIALIGWTSSYATLLICVAVASIGAAMFHPSVAGMVATFAGRKFGLSMSIFNMGGALSFGLGPLFVAWIVSRWGLAALLWTALPGFAVMAVLYYVVPSPRGEGLQGKGFFPAMRDAFGEVWLSVLLIWLVMVLRGFVAQVFITFIPVLYASKGHSLLSIGLVVSLFELAGALTTLLAGHLSDRIGYRPIYYVCLALATPCLWLMLFARGSWIYVLSAVAGGLMFATLPLGLVMAQKLAPRGKSMVSSFMMGLSVGLGGMMSPLVGGLADAFSIPTVLSFVALIPVASLGMVFFFPEKRLRETRVVG